jgi:hypothetical protein
MKNNDDIQEPYSSKHHTFEYITKEVTQQQKRMVTLT